VPLDVEMPLGSSPMVDAVIRVLENIDSLSLVKVGPPLYEQPVPNWCCKDAGDYLALQIPISNGYRIFLIEHYTGRAETGNSTHQLIQQILRQLKTTNLPFEVAEEDKSRRKPASPQSKQPTAQPTKKTTPSSSLPPTVTFSPKPIRTVASVPTVQSPATVLNNIRELAGEDGFVIGLIPKLHNMLGGDKVTLELTVEQLLTEGKLECNDRNIVLENYQRYTLK